MTTDRLRVEANERIDIEDFRSIGESDANNMRQLGHKFLMEETVVTSHDRTGYIMSGFKPSNPTGTQVQVDKGIALLSQLIDGAVYQGVLTTEGDSSIIIDINSYLSGTYGIYIRFEEVLAEPQGRIFWNSAGAGSEYVQSIDTKFGAKWGVRIEVASPGTEWLKIAEVDRDTMTVTDMRPFYFEGTVDSGYLSGWSSDGGGLATDRNADRLTYGINNIHKFSQSMRQCIEDIKGRGLRRWYERDIGGMNIGFDANPIEGRLALGDDEFYLEVTGTSPNDQPSIVVNAATDTSRIYYDRTSDSFNLEINDGVIHTFDKFKLHTHDLELDGEVVSDLIPDTTRNIGSSGSPWGYVYAEDVDTDDLIVSALVKSNLNPDISSRTLGTSVYEWGEAHVDDVLVYSFLTMESGSEVHGDLIPSVHGTYDLGSALKYWQVARMKLLVPGTGAGSDEGCANLVPGQDSTFDLGEKTTPQRWRNAYVDKVYEAEAEYLWARDTASTTVSESAWTSILPDTHIQASGLTVAATSGRLQCTAGHEGWYKGDVVWIMDPQANDVLLSLETYRNGTKITNSIQSFNMKAANDEIQVHYTFLARLDVTTDYVEIKAKHDSVGNVVLVGTDSFLTVVRCKKTEV